LLTVVAGKLGNSHHRAPKIRPELIFWAPLRLTGMKDRWAMKAKTRDMMREETTSFLEED
jgi:hypothetical protein